MDMGGEFMEELGKLFLFSEWNSIYCIFWVFISLMKVGSSFYYLGICANIHVDWYEIEANKIIMAIFESLFLLDMIVNFFRKVTPDGQSRPLDTMQKISWNYLGTNFIFHLIPLIPFQYIIGGGKERQYWLIIKTYRLKEGLDCFDVPKIMNQIKQMRIKRLKNLVQNSP